MKKLILPTLIIGAMSLGIVTAQADNHGGDKGHKGDKFAKMDLDSDGFVTKAEFLSKAEEKFAKMDANGDGKVSEDEAKAAKEARKGKKGKKAE